MSPDEIEETPGSEEPKRPRRRKARKADTPEGSSAAEAPRSSEAEGESDDETTRVASSADVPSSASPDEPTDTAEELSEVDEPESEAEAADEEPEAEAKPAPRRRRRKADEAEAEEPKAAPARRRRAERPVGPPPVVRAQAKYVRSSPRKARLVCDHIRGKSVEEARAILAFAPRSVAKDWSKLLESAVANAEHNHELVGEDLYVKAVHADDGPTIKRFRPRAMGRATKIRKRTSHLTILLTPKDG
jgi:ribosomal protein L22